MLIEARLREWNCLRLGLVLCGGGAKGSYEGGVFKALHQLDLADKITAVSGTSVGALGALLFAMDEPALVEKLWEEIGFSTVLSRTDADNEKHPYFKTLYSRIKGDTFSLRDLSDLPDAALETTPFNQDKLRDLLLRSVNFDRLRQSGRALFVCAYDVEAHMPKYFSLEGMTNEQMVTAALASSAIPYVYPMVEIDGRKYADGGVNIAKYGANNPDNMPMRPIEGLCRRLIVVHLSHSDNIPQDGSIHIVPSRSLEPVKGTGTLNFRRSTLRQHYELGYRDALATLSPLMAGFLSGALPSAVLSGAMLHN